ncbi:hypothetical protein CRYUN_Cryun09bG0062200 [Craigia yunnanensis]
MASMLAKHSSIFFLALFFTIIFFSALSMADHQSDYSEVKFSKYISPSSLGLKREKLSHLHFYFHDIISGKNATACRVAEAPSTNHSSTLFGATVMIDDPLTIKPDVNSKIVGRAQGMEMPIVGGSGVFRFARGYAQARTYSNTQIHTIVEYNVYQNLTLASTSSRNISTSKLGLKPEKLSHFHSSTSTSMTFTGLIPPPTAVRVVQRSHYRHFRMTRHVV